MAQPFSASMALAPLSARRVPDRLGRSPNCRHPPSTTPLPTWTPRSRNPSYRIRPGFLSKYLRQASTSPCRSLNGADSRTTFAARPALMSAFTSANRRSRSADRGGLSGLERHLEAERPGVGAVHRAVRLVAAVASQHLCAAARAASGREAGSGQRTRSPVSGSYTNPVGSLQPAGIGQGIPKFRRTSRRSACLPKARN